ncbi:hypothetical protein IIC38_19895 [candidate division KSB1 bacterium]|nr:hypothetical protein [candidate division KSB1 bacterium]
MALRGFGGGAPKEIFLGNKVKKTIDNGRQTMNREQEIRSNKVTKAQSDKVKRTMDNGR